MPAPMPPLELVRLSPLMRRTSGRPGILVALIDGPVLMAPPGPWTSNVRHLSAVLPATCSQPSSSACLHGTFVAGILAAKRGSQAPSICPDCTLLVRPVFSEQTQTNSQMPSATPPELADAILDTVNAGAHIINLSLAVAHSSTRGERQLEAALNYAANRGVLIAAAAGNQGEVGASVVSRHPWVISVAGCDPSGRPMSQSNFGGSIGRFGLLAPGDNITSLGPTGDPETFGGTSAATPFVSGTLALLWSEFPSAAASTLKLALAGRQARTTVVPPLLDAEAAYQSLASQQQRRNAS
jgi:subtilisin family serine protease